MVNGNLYDLTTLRKFIFYYYYFFPILSFLTFVFLAECSYDDCGEHGICGIDGICYCDQGFKGKDCNEVLFFFLSLFFFLYETNHYY